MTIYTDTGISLGVYTSRFAGGEYLFDLTHEVESYSHTIDALGGYRSARISLAGTQEEAEDWLEYGLARHIETYSHSGEAIFEGFVNQVGISIGGLQVTRGPLLDTANRVYVSYTPLDTSVIPPVAGSQTNTPMVNDTATQALYGIIENSVNGGKITDANALQVRGSFLQEHKDPQISQRLDLSGGEMVKISLDIAGYVEYLDKNGYTYSSTANTTVSAKVITLLAADPNALISTDVTGIATNTLATPSSEEKRQTIWAVLSSLVALGDSSYNRYTLGVYAGRRIIYQAAPVTFDYRMRLSENTIERYSGGELYPWEILPARWLFYADFLPGRGPAASDLRSDPRAQFIESVEYTAPFGLYLSGGKTDKLSQRLAQLAGSAGGI